jgi:hypothetical protein
VPDVVGLVFGGLGDLAAGLLGCLEAAGLVVLVVLVCPMVGVAFAEAAPMFVVDTIVFGFLESHLSFSLSLSLIETDLRAKLLILSSDASKKNQLKRQSIRKNHLDISIKI